MSNIERSYSAATHLIFRLANLLLADENPPDQLIRDLFGDDALGGAKVSEKTIKNMMVIKLPALAGYDQNHFDVLVDHFSDASAAGTYAETANRLGWEEENHTLRIKMANLVQFISNLNGIEAPAPTSAAVASDGGSSTSTPKTKFYNLKTSSSSFYSGLSTGLSTRMKAHNDAISTKLQNSSSALQKVLSDNPQWKDEVQTKLIEFVDPNLVYFPKKQARIYALIIFVFNIIVLSSVTHGYMKEPTVGFETMDADWMYGEKYERKTGKKVWSTDIFYRYGPDLYDYYWLPCNWFHSSSCDDYVKVDGYEGICDDSRECWGIISVGYVIHMDLSEAFPLALTYLPFVNLTLLLIFFSLHWLYGSSAENNNMATLRMAHILKQIVNVLPAETEGVLDVEQPDDNGAILDEEKGEGTVDPALAS